LGKRGGNCGTGRNPFRRSHSEKRRGKAKGGKTTSGIHCGLLEKKKMDYSQEQQTKKKKQKK